MLALAARADGLADILHIGDLRRRAGGQLAGNLFTEQTIVENDDSEVSQGKRLLRLLLGDGIVGLGAQNKKLIAARLV